MDFFSVLPPRLLGDILQSLDTFDTLHSAISASPALYRTFRDQGPTIVSTLAANTLEPEIHHAVHAVARIRTEPIPQSTTTVEELRSTYGAGFKLLQRPSRLSSSLSPQVCHGLVATIVNIGKLSTAVLNELLRRISTLKIQHPVNRGIDLSSGVYSRIPDQNPWPAGQDISIPASATNRPPSWVEHYRILRALWLVQIGLDIRRSAPWVAWSIDPPSEPGAWMPGSLSGWYSSDTAVGLAAKVLEQSVAARVEPGWDGIAASSPALVKFTKMPCAEFMVELGLESDMTPRDDDVGRAWSQDREAIRQVSDGRLIFRQLFSNRHITMTPWMMMSWMEAGLMIWDRQRLFDLGLINKPRIESGVRRQEGEYRQEGMSEDEIWFAWCSIRLSPDL